MSGAFRSGFQSWIARLDRVVATLFSVVAALTVSGLAAIIVLQVFQRYVMNRSLDWPDEMAGVLLAWITFVGAALVARDNEHISVTIAADNLPPFWSDVVRVITDLIVILLLWVYVWFSIPMVMITWGQTLITVPISRGFLFTVLPISALVMIGYVLAASPLTRRLRRPPREEPAARQ